TRKRLLVAVSGEEQVVGFVRYNHRVRGVETALYDICVVRDRQRMGIGTVLVSALAAECQEAGRSSIVRRWPEGAGANAFYKWLGFRHCGIVPGRRRRLVVWRIELRGSTWSS